MPENPLLCRLTSNFIYTSVCLFCYALCLTLNCLLYLASEFLIPCGDWNDHVGHAGTGYREVHGGIGYGRPEPDVEGERILEYTLAFDLLLGNTCL